MSYAIGVISKNKKRDLGNVSLNYARYEAKMDIITSWREAPVRIWENVNGQSFMIGTVYRADDGKIRWSAATNSKEISVLINNDGSLRKKAVKSQYGIKGKLKPFGL